MTVTNRQIADVFKLAKDFLPQEKCICHAIHEARLAYRYYWTAGRAAKEIIRQRMTYRGVCGRPRQYIYLEDFIFTVDPEAERRGGYAAAMMEYRMRWLDALIEEFSA